MKRLTLEKKLNKETDGMYLDLVNYNDLRSRTAYPTIVHGLYSLTADLFDKILEFIVLGDIKELRNKVWIEKTGTYLKF